MASNFDKEMKDLQEEKERQDREIAQKREENERLRKAVEEKEREEQRLREWISEAEKKKEEAWKKWIDLFYSKFGYVGHNGHLLLTLSLSIIFTKGRIESIECKFILLGLLSTDGV